MIIQDWCSRHESIRLRLSNEQRQWGVGWFHGNKVPFSIRSGSVFAKRLIKIFMAHCQSLEKKDRLPDHWTIVEYGAGMGLLSRQCLRVLESDYKDYFNRTSWIVSEASPEMLTAMRVTRQFSDFGDRVHCKEVDALMLEDSEETPLLMASTYLLDSLPSYQFEINDGRLYEIQVQTSIDDRLFLDTSQFPPKWIDASELMVLLTDKSMIKRRRLIALSVQKYLKESFRVVPIDASNVDDKTVEHVKQYVDCHTLSSGRFNYHADHLDHILASMNILHEQGIYLLSDFGFASEIANPAYPLLTATYGAAAFHAICFPMIRWHLEARGLSVRLTNNESDQTQECLISKAPLSTDVSAAFFRVCHNLGYERILGALDTLGGLIKTPHYQHEVTQITNELKQEELEDAYFMISLATQLLDDGYADDAEVMANDMICVHGGIQVDAIRLLGCISQHRDQHDMALRAFRKVISLWPNDSMTHSAMAVSYMCGNDFEQASKSLKKAICFSSEEAVWQQLLALCLAYRHGKKKKAMEALISHINTLDKENPGVIPGDMIQRFNKQIVF